MFDLEAQIRSWRQSLPPALADHPEAVDELESHLRDAVEELGLAPGVKATAAVKATSVMVERSGH